MLFGVSIGHVASVGGLHVSRLSDGARVFPGAFPGHFPLRPRNEADDDWRDYEAFFGWQMGSVGNQVWRGVAKQNLIQEGAASRRGLVPISGPK